MLIRSDKIPSVNTSDIQPLSVCASGGIWRGHLSETYDVVSDDPSCENSASTCEGIEEPEAIFLVEGYILEP